MSFSLTLTSFGFYLSVNTFSKPACLVSFRFSVTDDYEDTGINGIHDIKSLRIFISMGLAPLTQNDYLTCRDFRKSSYNSSTRKT